MGPWMVQSVLLYVSEKPGMRDSITPTIVYLVFVYSKATSSRMGWIVSYDCVRMLFRSDIQRDIVGTARPGEGITASSMLQSPGVIQMPVGIKDSMLNHHAGLTGK